MAMMAWLKAMEERQGALSPTEVYSYFLATKAVFYLIRCLLYSLNAAPPAMAAPTVVAVALQSAV